MWPCFRNQVLQNFDARMNYTCSVNCSKGRSVLESAPTHVHTCIYTYIVWIMHREMYSRTWDQRTCFCCCWGWACCCWGGWVVNPRGGCGCAYAWGAGPGLYMRTHKIISKKSCSGNPRCAIGRFLTVHKFLSITCAWHVMMGVDVFETWNNCRSSACRDLGAVHADYLNPLKLLARKWPDMFILDSVNKNVWRWKWRGAGKET